MTNFVWLLRDVVLALHSEQLAEHGGLEGIRDAGMLDSALARPQKLAAYEDGVSLSKVAASYPYGLAKNHPFIDGNKRISFFAGEVFLALNGYELTADDGDCVLTMLAIADGSLSEEALSEWYTKNSRPKD